MTEKTAQNNNASAQYICMKERHVRSEAITCKFSNDVTAVTSILDSQYLNIHTHGYTNTLTASQICTVHLHKQLSQNAHTNADGDLAKKPLHLPKMYKLNMTEGKRF